MKSIPNTNLRQNENYFSKGIFVYLFILCAFSLNVSAQTIFTTSGTYTVPAGVTSIKVECIGGGGAGSSIKDNSGKGGGGGGGGAYASSIINVTAGTSYTVVVGAGGVGTNGNSPRDNGGNSSFDATTVVAAGGLGGENNNVGGGSGGAISSSIGTIKYAGGNGGNGTLAATYSGGGGGAAGTNGAGGAALGITPGVGTATYGGSGAAGITAVNNGNLGNTYGGGGSGALTTTNDNHAGGVGGSGVVIITVASVTNIVEVNATLGTATAYYTTLKDAFDAINAGIHQDTIQVKINKSTTETATASLNASGTGGANYTDIILYPTSIGLSITGSLLAPLIQLNGANNVTIDGRVNLSDSANLVISNTSAGAGARTIELINSAQNNNIQYCTITGAGPTATQGIINFSTASSGPGNDGNYIQYCYIAGATATNRPANAICSIGTIGADNSSNIIRNNEIFDCLMRGAASNGIYISTNSTAFTITGNSFYETASFIPTAPVEYAVIRIDSPTGNDFVISGNYIGGKSALCAGTAWTKTNTFNNTFNAIYINSGTNNNSVQGNIIQNFVYANSGAANWYGIYVAGGTINTGTTSGNTIGATTGTGSILFTGGATGATFTGICISSANSTTCSNNIIGSITAASSNTANATNFYGIYKMATAGTTTINNNLVGSTTTASSINTSSAATGNSQLLYGIYSLGTGTITIYGNTIQNLTNSTTETTVASKLRGIFANGGSNSIQNNNVISLKTGGVANGGNNNNASLVGISLISTTANQDISNNTVNGIETTATGKIEMYGIYYSGITSGTNTVLRNFISNFIVPTGGLTSTSLQGISLNGGDFTTANNIVYLGSNISVGCSIWGINNASTGAIKVYHNTVYISGSAPSNTSSCYSFGATSCPVTADIRNNILWNARTSTGATINYAIALSCSTNLTLDYNDYNFSKTFGAIGATSYSTFANWQAAFSPGNNEVHSLTTDPQLVNPGGNLSVDYQTKTQLQGVSGTGITTDFDGVARTTPTMGAWEYFPSPVEIWNAATYRNAYTTLKGAFDAINAGTYTGDLTIKLKGNTTETTAAILNASGTGTANYTSILIYPTRSGVTVTGNFATPLIDLNGADKVTFDGRVNSTGDPNELIFVNTNTANTSGNSTFRFINSAENNTIQYCVVKGASTATVGGNIYFATATSGNGNDANTISSNYITSVSSSSRPVNVIYSQGSATFENSGNIIQNNRIYDFLNLESTSYGINIGTNSTAFTITGNSFYQTTSLVPTANVSYKVINIDNTLGGSFAVSGNYIGGSAALCSGTWTKTGSNNNFYALNLNVGSATASSVNGNVISKITHTNSGAASWYGINVAAGAVNIGNTTGNIIGGTSGTGSISLTNVANDSIFYGINIASSGIVSCQNNSIGSVTTLNNSTTLATHLYAINKTATAGTTTISNNTIGSTTTAASLNASSASTANAQSVYGIYSAGTGDINISGNTIANLTNGTTNTATTTRGKINGICVGGGSSNVITNNTVRNLTIANANAANDVDMPTIGINLINAVAGRNVSGNTIYSLGNTGATFAGFVSGIYYRGSASGTNTVSKNFIYGLTATSASGSLAGIIISSGNTTYSNNIVTLSTNAGNVVYGIYDVGQASQTTKLYFNTVYIGGTGTTLNSFAMYSGLALNTRDYRNNIFNNSRNRNSKNGAGSHYAINYATSGTSNLTVDYNDYYVNGTGGVLAVYSGSDILTIAALRTTTGKDANSVNTAPLFNTPQSTIPIEYRVGAKLVGVDGTGITVDYGSNSRPITNLTMGAWETNSNKWIGTKNNDWNDNANWSGNIVPAAESSIQFSTSTANDLYLDQDRIITDFNNQNVTKKIVTKGNKLTIKGDIMYANGTIDASAPSSTVEFASATATQSIPSGAFYNNQVYDLIINNTYNVTLNGTLKLLNSITATAGYLDAFTNAPSVIYAGANPQSLENARFLSNKIHDLTIDNAFGVNLNTDITVSNNLTINSGKLLTISILNQMQVLGTVTNNAGTAGLVIKSSPVAPNGSFIFNNPSSKPVAATVEMYTKAFASVQNPVTKAYSGYKWQYFGIPVAKVVTNPTFVGSYVRKWVESGTTVSNHWVQLVNTDSVYSFLGYEITQPVPKTLVFQGNLINSNYSSGKLKYTPTALYPGQNVLANPYTSAIDIRQMDFGTDMELTVYLYNTGSLTDWTSGEVQKVQVQIPGNTQRFRKILPDFQVFHG